MKRFIKFALRVFRFLLNTTTKMPNCCSYTFVYTTPVDRILESIDIIDQGVTETVPITGGVFISNIAGTIAAINASLTAAGYSNTGTWSITFTGGHTRTYTITVSDVHFSAYQGDGTNPNHTYYNSLLFSGGIIVTKQSGQCEPCEAALHEGSFSRCEKCIEITYNNCPDEITFETDLSSAETYYAWLENKYGHFYVIPITITDGVATIDTNYTDVYSIKFPHSGGWMIYVSTSEERNTKTIIRIIDSLEYECVIVKFIDEE